LAGRAGRSKPGLKIDLPQASDALDQRLHEAGRRNPAPELHVCADKATRYEVLAEVMSEASKDGVTRIGFVTDPLTP